MPAAYIGLSGYSYKPWQGEERFYPPGLKQADFLGYYTGRYAAVEMDGTWYRHPGEKAVEDWLARTPAGFRFSFKLHRQITHLSRLKLDSMDSLKFMLKRLAPMARDNRLGPFLVQLPPNMKRNDERLAEFFDAAPKSFSEVEDGPAGVPVRYSVEFRNDTWNHDDVAAILQERGVGWVASDTDETDAVLRETAPHHHMRLRKADYDDAVLEKWAAHIRGVVEVGKEAYVYLKHEDEGSPWIWADALMRKLGPFAQSPLAPAEPVGLQPRPTSSA